MKQKRYGTLILTSILCIALIASRAINQKSEHSLPTDTVGGAPSPVTLVTVSMHGGTDPNTDNYNAINEKFMAEYDYITIEDESQVSDQDWKIKIAADFAVGNEPDVIQYFTDANASDVLAADKFVSIETIKDEYPDYAKDTLPSSLETAQNPDGISRAVPTTVYWEGLYCNKDLFDQYNLELPTDWDKFIKAIDIFQSHNIIPVAVSLNHVPHYWIEFLMLSSAGIDSYKSIPETAPTEWVRGLEMFKTLRDLGAFPKDTDTIDENYINELFINKKAAMTLNGSWFLNGVTDQRNTVICSFPVIPEGKAEPGFIVSGISSGFYITKKAWNDPDKRDAAVKFVMAHTCSESVAMYCNGMDQSAAVIDQIKGLTPLGNSALNYRKAATGICAPTDSRISQEAYSTLVAGIVDVSTGIKSAEELLNQVLKINTK
ncbi:MAG: family 1 extracellular solute-binding protein [Herbinix sp.]|nr:family 1 extracellular solute-binding protein [Herbinix sp.]